MGAPRAAPSARGESAPRGARRVGAAGGRARAGRVRVRKAAHRAGRTKGRRRAARRVEPQPGRQVRAGRRAEPRCRDGAQPGRAPAPGPERQAEREPEPQAEPGPGRRPGPRGRAARSGGDGAPQRLRGLLPALAGGRDAASPRSREAGGSPTASRPRAPQESGGRPPEPTQNDSPTGDGEDFLRVQETATSLRCRGDSPLRSGRPPRPRTQ